MAHCSHMVAAGRALVLAVAMIAAADPVPAANINYQARLEDGDGAPLEGVQTLFVRLYSGGDATTPNSGVLLFSESAPVTANAGTISHAIGSGIDLLGTPLTTNMFTTTGTVHLQAAIGIESNVILPRTRLHFVPLAFKAADSDSLGGLPALAYAPVGHAHDGVYVRRVGTAHVIVESTHSATLNGANLLVAYTQAKTLTPNGAPPSNTNRAILLVAPGNYDLGTAQLELDAEFVDVAGLSTVRESQYIYGITNGSGTGVLRQTANNVRIENLLVQCTRSFGALQIDSAGPAAYFPDSGTTATVVRNCEFRDDGDSHSFSTRIFTNYPGTYRNCRSGDYSFGARASASGYFNQCVAGKYSFGFGVDSVASGYFEECTAGIYSYGSFGAASGDFVRCLGSSFSFGYQGTALGRFSDCSGADNSFGGQGGNTSGGSFVRCRMYGPGYDAVFAGRMEDCHWSSDLSLAFPARIYSSTIGGTVNLNGTTAGLTLSRAQDIVSEFNNVFGATSTAALNIEAMDVN